MQRRIDDLEANLEKLDGALSEQKKHVSEMHDRAIAIQTGLKVVGALVMAVLVTVMGAAWAMAERGVVNEASIRAIQERQLNHRDEGHPSLRREVAEVATEVRAINAQIEDLGQDLREWRREDEAELARGRSTRHRSSGSRRSRGAQPQ